MLNDSCFTIRSRVVMGSVGGGGDTHTDADDAVVDSIRTLFRLVLKLKPSSALPLIDTLVRVNRVPPGSHGRRSLPYLSPTAPHDTPVVVCDPLCAAYASTARALITHRLWAAGDVTVAVPGVVAAYSAAFTAAAAVYETPLVEALVSHCEHLASTRALPKPVTDSLNADAAAALAKLRGFDKLLPLYYAVYFIGPAFPEVPLRYCVCVPAFVSLLRAMRAHCVRVPSPQALRDRWYVYRVEDSVGGLEFVNHMRRLHPGVCVHCVDSPICVGATDVTVFEPGHKGGPPPPTDAAPAPHTTVYTPPYVFLGAGSYGIASQSVVTTVPGGVLCAHGPKGPTVAPPPSHMYVYPAMAVPTEEAVCTPLGEAPARPPPFLGTRFRAFVPRAVTRYTPTGGGPIPSPPPTLRHTINHDGPCISRQFDDGVPVDTLLTHAEASAVMCLDLTLTTEMTSALGEDTPPQDAAVLCCPWITRRCPVALAHLRPVGIADACLQWLEWANSVIVNRLRWAYSITIRSDNPGDGPSLWPGRRDRVGSLIRQPTAGTFGVDAHPGQGQGWGNRRASLLGAHAPPQYRQLCRSDKGVEEVVRTGHVWRAMAEAVGMTSLLEAEGDSFDTVDIGADDVPQMLPVLHRRRGPVGADGDPHAPSEFVVTDLGEDATVATAASGGVYLDGRVVGGGTAAEVLCATVLNVCHPKLAFPCGLRVIKLLLNDYRCGCVCVCASALWRSCVYPCVCVCVCVCLPVWCGVCVCTQGPEGEVHDAPAHQAETQPHQVSECCCGARVCACVTSPCARVCGCAGRTVSVWRRARPPCPSRTSGSSSPTPPTGWWSASSGAPPCWPSWWARPHTNTGRCL